MSKKYSFNKEDLTKIFQTVFWTMATAGIAALIAAWQSIDLPPEWLFAGPIINSALYAIQKFIVGK